MEISKFYRTEYPQFALYDTYRKLASYVDGLKPSARKIVHTIRKRNITTPIKVSNLSSTVSVETEYLHGQTSLEGVCVGLAQDFVGTNNINLIKPDGSFGNRSITEAAASRYIFTYKEPIMDAIFRKEDDAVLIKQEFEGTIIEPRFFVPIIPMLFVNGSEGVGTGFAQNILPRDIKAIIPEIEHYLKKGEFKSEFLPIWYKGFKGTIERSIKKDGVVSLEIFGHFEKIGRAKILIDELPIGYDHKGYIAVLDALEEAKVIKGYTDIAEGLDFFAIEVKVDMEFFNLDRVAQYDKLKLVKRVVENWTCIGEDNKVKEFKSEFEVLKAYCDIRIEFYELRRLKMISDLTQRLNVLQNRFSFVERIIQDEFDMRRPKDDIIVELEELSFMKVDESYSYLLNMPMHSMTATTMVEMRKDMETIKAQITELEATTPQQMWLKDLKQFVKEYK